MEAAPEPLTPTHVGAGVTAELLAPARRWLITMAGRSFGLSFSLGPELAL